MKDVIWISAVGAGLVIIGLMILWLFMDILVRATTVKTKINTGSRIEEEGETGSEQLSKAKQLAAAAAVSVALLKASHQPAIKTSGHMISTWQSSHRYSQLHNIPQHQSLKRNTK